MDTLFTAKQIEIVGVHHRIVGNSEFDYIEPRVNTVRCIPDRFSRPAAPPEENSHSGRSGSRPNPEQERTTRLDCLDGHCAG